MPRWKKFLSTPTLVLLHIFFFSYSSFTQSPASIQTINKRTGLSEFVREVSPLDTVYLLNTAGTVTVKDARGKAYFHSKAAAVLPFVAGGSLGTHTIYSTDEKGITSAVLQFNLKAETNIDDGDFYNQMFKLFNKGMREYAPEGFEQLDWNGKPYRFFVHWGLDHFHTMKGMLYFKGFGTEFVDMMRFAQREDGMIYSFVHLNMDTDYFLTRDKYSGYTKKIGDRFFTRQPTENHPEYIYVNTIYLCWKTGAGDEWMKTNLASAAKALDYSMNDPARWSKRFGLLKRVYTIDSWDFQVEDEYLPDLGLTNSMIIDPVKSKFGIFFGDNTGYIAACRELSEMYLRAGEEEASKKFRDRADTLAKRLDQLAWNGRFFTHFIEEDSTVKRKLGVDERSQFAQSNAYSINRYLKPAQNKSIIEAYSNLKQHLPPGSPGEWYAIYPPFGGGFEKHNPKWQYMNGGVGGHVAGELARGAFENGYESYASGILERLFELGKKYGNKIWFAYTGAFPEDNSRTNYKPLDLSTIANMDSWDKGSKDVHNWMLTKKEGDDFRRLPTGKQVFAGIPFNVLDPANNARKAVVAVSNKKSFPSRVAIPVNDTAGAIYLLHTSSKPSSENLAATFRFEYADGTNKIQYLLMEKHLTYWWFSKLKTTHSGIAWYGKNDVSEGIGLSWCAIDNPSPSKKITRIVLEAPSDEGIYTLFAATTATLAHKVPVSPTSFGGPDNWAAATAMAALIQGQAGIKDSEGSEGLSKPVVSPRWVTTKADSIGVVVHYPSSDGYVAYRYVYDKNNNQLRLTTTGNAPNIHFRVLLPGSISSTPKVHAGKELLQSTVEQTEKSRYLVFDLKNEQPTTVVINF